MSGEGSCAHSLMVAENVFYLYVKAQWKRKMYCLHGPSDKATPASLRAASSVELSRFHGHGRHREANPSPPNHPHLYCFLPHPRRTEAIPSAATPRSCLCRLFLVLPNLVIVPLVGNTGGEAGTSRDGVRPGMGQRMRAAGRLRRHRRWPRRMRGRSGRRRAEPGREREADRTDGRSGAFVGATGLRWRGGRVRGSRRGDRWAVARRARDLWSWAQHPGRPRSVRSIAEPRPGNTRREVRNCFSLILDGNRVVQWQMILTVACGA